MLHSYLSEIFQKRSVPENSVVGNLRSQTIFYNYHNPRGVFDLEPKPYGTFVPKFGTSYPLILRVLPRILFSNKE